MIRLGAALVLALLLGYGLVKGFPLISGPHIRLDSPAPYASLPGGEAVLSGRASNTETLTVNDGVLLIDQEGDFRTTLTLPPGGAILSLTAKDRFGKSVTKQVTVYSP